MKRRVYLFALALALLLTACAQQEKKSGIPTLEEVAEMESLYGLTRDELLEKLHLGEEDLLEEENNWIVYPTERTIAGQPVTERAFFDMTTPEHMGAWFFILLAVLENGQEDALLEVYDEAVDIYGEPNQVPTPSNREDLLDYLERLKAGKLGEEDAAFSVSWLVGEQTKLGLSFVATEEGLGINFSYRMQPMIP